MHHQDHKQSHQRSRASDPGSLTERATAPGKRTQTQSLLPEAHRPSAPALVQVKPDASSSATADGAADAGCAERAVLTRQWLDTAMRADLYPPPVQMEGGSALAADEVHELAAQGISDAASTLPHLGQIQRSFGAHDVSGIKAHVGGAAAEATRGMGAAAYATGDHVAFGDTPSLHTAAHEAAHVVQQRGGVQLAGGIGSAGDVYEEHADAVADAVVRGRSAEVLLDLFKWVCDPGSPGSAANTAGAKGRGREEHDRRYQARGT